MKRTVLGQAVQLKQEEQRTKRDHQLKKTARITPENPRRRKVRKEAKELKVPPKAKNKSVLSHHLWKMLREQSLIQITESSSQE